MSKLTLVGLHDDGEHVVLEGPDGQRFRLPIDDALRAAVRRDRPQLEQVRAEQTGTVPPREIQARIRAGATAADVAEASGMPVELVRRYEGPVLAEREYVAAQARSTRIGRESGAPELGELVMDRLATRGVAPGSIAWDAARSGSGPWSVEVRFEVGGAERSARWTFDPGTRTVRATDDEARWLSETELADEPIPRRHLAAVRDAVFDIEVDAALRPLLAAVDLSARASSGSGGAREALDVTENPDDALPTVVVVDPAEATHALLDDLSGRRGVRQPLEESEEDDDDEGFEGFGPQHAFDFEHPGLTTPLPPAAHGPYGEVPPAAHPPSSRPDLAQDATVLELPGRTAPHGADPHPDPHPDEEPALADVPDPAVGRRASGRKGRASVPSWDEIVFGAKPE